MKYLKHLAASALAFIIIGLPFQALGTEKSDSDSAHKRVTTALSGTGVAKSEKEAEEKQRFLKGVLVYRPNEGSKEGEIKLRIRDLVNPLEDTFDLSSCGDVAKLFSISTGYRKKENGFKLEMWLAPRFLVKKELQEGAKHLQPLFPDKWPKTAPIGIFWNVGHWPKDTYDYLTTDFDEVSDKNLMKLWIANQQPNIPKWTTYEEAGANNAGSGQTTSPTFNIEYKWYFAVHFPEL